MFKIDLDKIATNLYENIMLNIDIYLPKIVWALVVLLLWLLIAIIIHKFVMYLFKKFKIIELIDKLNIKFDSWDEKTKELKEENKKIFRSKISDKIKVNEITAKATSYYIFLVFFRYSISIIWIEDVENFMKELLLYLPSLFIWIIVWFFWVRFANFVYDVTYNALNLTKQKTAKIIASGAKIIILFFTLMVVLNKIWIDSQITETILIWFISMLAISWWLAFWLWWKDIAQEILESFKK
jgi:hypothetical protein